MGVKLAMKHMLAVMAVLMLPGCDGAGLNLPTLPGLGGQRDATGHGIRTLSLLEGSVRVRAPEGYCIDQSASRARSGFVMMAGCAVVADEIGVMPSLDGLLTVQFGDVGSAGVDGNEAILAALLQGDSADAAGSDEPGGDVAELYQSANRVILRHDEVSPPEMSGTTGPVWRGFMDVRGRLVTITVRSFDRAPLRNEEARRLLEITMSEVAQANAAQTSDQSN